MQVARMILCYRIKAAVLAAIFSLVLLGSVASAAERYTPGFKLYQYHLEDGISVADDPLPPAELGAFVAKRSEYTYKESIEKLGIPASSGRLYRAFGYLNVKEPATYTIIAASGEEDVYGSIFVNEKKVISGLRRPFVLTAPVHFSKPGLYPVDIRIYTSVDRDKITASHVRCYPYAEFKFLIKTPKSDSPLPAHKVLLLPLSK